MHKLSLSTRLLYNLDAIKNRLLNPLYSIAEQDISSFKKFTHTYLQKQRLEKRSIINQHGDGGSLISIILPVLDSEQTIQRAIDSIQKQSYENWELIIIDDGSIDATYDYINASAKQDSRIRLYKNTSTKGVAHTRNVGLRHAKGDYITFHDADDRSHPDRLLYQLAELCAQPSLKVVTFLYCRETSNEEPIVTNGKVRWNRVSGMMFGRDVFIKLGYFKALNISEDSEYYERIRAVYGKKACKKIEKLLYYSLFDTSSLLFSNADVEIKGGEVFYKIKPSENKVLEQCRRMHGLLKQNATECYESFESSDSLYRAL